MILADVLLARSKSQRNCRFSGSDPNCTFKGPGRVNGARNPDWPWRIAVLHSLVVHLAFAQPAVGFADVRHSRQQVMTDRSDAVATAARLLSAKRQLAQIWPRFWPESQPFIIYLEGKGALLITSGAKPSGFDALVGSTLPSGFSGKAYWRSGELPDVIRPFITNYPVGAGSAAILVNAAGLISEETTTLLLHEQFHAFQQSSFKKLESGQFVRPNAFGPPIAFAASAELERRILAEAVIAPDLREARRLLVEYFNLRQEREATMTTEAVRVEREFERLEGTAKFVDRSAVAITFKSSAVHRLLVEELRKPLWLEKGSFQANWFRHRAYGTGAALTHLAARFGHPSWRTQIEEGLAPDQLVSLLVGEVEPARSKFLAQRTRSRLGYDAIVRELTPTIQAGWDAEIKSVAEFLEQSPYRLILHTNGDSKASVGFNAAGMTQLGPGTLALPNAATFSYLSPSIALTSRHRPVLMDGERSRYIVLTRARPSVVGLERAGLGKFKLEGLRVKSEGIYLEIKRPVEVLLTEGEVLVSLSEEYSEGYDDKD